MKLTEVTSILGWYSDSVNGVEKEVKEARKQVKEWREGAEKWNKLDAMITGGLTELKNDHEIVEQVKKRIEDTDSNIKYYDGLSHYSGADAHGRACANMNAEKRFCEIKLQSELQKILERKK